jgi:hypothetical protein
MYDADAYCWSSVFSWIYVILHGKDELHNKRCFTRFDRYMIFHKELNESWKKKTMRRISLFGDLFTYVPTKYNNYDFELFNSNIQMYWSCRDRIILRILDVTSKGRFQSESHIQSPHLWFSK